MTKHLVDDVSAMDGGYVGSDQIKGGTSVNAKANGLDEAAKVLEAQNGVRDDTTVSSKCELIRTI